MKQMTLRGDTLSAVRRRGELMDLRIADVSAKDVMLQINDAEFQDWCSRFTHLILALLSSEKLSYL